ncbi:hypothetical protein BDV27DRAFT_157807 [Aspergillus caelatus]|uniref:Uncharacterized protein n=1 Tax=Aspergillus caelatus TaxID=61420 RepID=A0A5N7A3R1_9EURO|nr:uncharacterized protein BDV27DRAFT_157807 [Aspergillus caelatus]KAE8364501.1 hypothetical protein BDV27DRAFT_157807 [Aspergillus caelatus]
MNNTKFEKDVGPVKVKGEIDEKTGQIKGEIGIVAPVVGYKSIKPFAGSITDGVHGKFGLGGGVDNASFVILVKDNDLKIQVNEPLAGHEITLFQLEKKAEGELRWRSGSDTYDAVFQVGLFRLVVKSGKINLPGTPIVTVNYRSLDDLVGRYEFEGEVGSEKLSLSLKRTHGMQNGARIEGKFLQPTSRETEFIFGFGNWNPEFEGSGTDDQLSGTIGRQQGAYDGIALPTAGMDKLFGSAA